MKARTMFSLGCLIAIAGFAGFAWRIGLWGSLSLLAIIVGVFIIGLCGGDLHGEKMNADYEEKPQ